MNRSPATTASLWKERYEALRQLAVGGQPFLETVPLGWVVLLGQGVAGWMRSWSEWVPMPTSEPASVAQVKDTSTTAWQQQLTELLAEMSLAHLSNPIPL